MSDSDILSIRYHKSLHNDVKHAMGLAGYSVSSSEPAFNADPNDAQYETFTLLVDRDDLKLQTVLRFYSNCFEAKFEKFVAPSMPSEEVSPMERLESRVLPPPGHDLSL